MRALFHQAFGHTAASRLGTSLIVAGLMLVVYSAGAFVGIVPGGYPTIPDPVALAGSQRAARLAPTAVETGAPRPAAIPATATALPAPTVAAGSGAAATLPPIATSEPRSTATPVFLKANPADADDRRQARRAPRSGAPVRLEIASIGVDTEVKAGGVVIGRDGEPEWETLPFVAVTYPQLGPVGGTGNPVIAGHVVTLNEGNVFRNLYQVKLGEQVEVYTADSRFSYVVDEVKLVEPSDVSVMQPTDDARLTLITCGGTFNPRTRTFSERLIVIGRLAGGERLEAPASS